MNVVRQSQERCSYKCPYYQDGPVISLCNKHKKQLRYDGNIPPLLTEECKAEMTTHNATSHRSAACGASGGLPGCASNMPTEKGA